MAAPTTIEVSVDSEEYSRYELDRNTITATVVVAGGAPYTSEGVTVSLVKARMGRDAVVATVDLSFTSTSSPQSAVATFYLPDIVDADLIHLVRHGRYFVRATSDTDTNIVGESPDFWVSIISVDRFKSQYLFGLPLTATEVKGPKFQPTSITGITITETSPGTPLGLVNLAYTYHEDDVTDATAVIGSGANGTVTITADEDNSGSDGNDLTVEVRVPAGTSGLSVSFLAPNQLLVDLAVAAGVPDDPQNTATLIAAAIDGLTGFSASASGTGADSISAASGPTQFAGGTTNIVRQLSWDGGPPVSITSSGVVVLPSGGSSSCGTKVNNSTNNYICIRVASPLLLPTTNVTESILMDRKKIEDEDLRQYICQAIDWVENDFLMTPIEPTNVVTDRDPSSISYSLGLGSPNPLFTDTDYDKIVSPLTYFVPRAQGEWISIQTPWPQLLRVDALFGAIANTRVIDVDLNWIEHSEQGGLIQLVPFNQETAFDYLGLIWVNSLRGAAELPNFWHYNAIVGLREATCDIIELVAKKAAVDALVVLGMALRPGVGSVSLSRDGVSESVSYINSAQYGVYTGTITAFKEWIDTEGQRLRAKYRGAIMRVV